MCAVRRSWRSRTLKIKQTRKCEVKFGKAHVFLKGPEKEKVIISYYFIVTADESTTQQIAPGPTRATLARSADGRGARGPTRLWYLGDLYAESGQTLQGSFSAVSKPNFASKYSLESSRRDLHNALLCTAF